MNKKVLAFDMDGTILMNDHFTFNQKAIEAMRKVKNEGHGVIIATGRSLAMITPLIIKNEVEGLFDYIVCNNGSYTYVASRDEIVTSGEIGKNEVQQLYNDGKETGSIFCAHSNKGIYVCTKTDPDPDNVILEIRSKYSSKEDVEKFIDKHTIVQASIMNKEGIIAKMSEDTDKYKNVNACVANNNWLDLNPIGASKLAGLEVVSKELGVALEDFIAFGDSGNDIEMLEGVGVGIAMGNGNEASKEAANITIGDNESDAIAIFIKDTFKV